PSAASESLASAPPWIEQLQSPARSSARAIAGAATAMDTTTRVRAASERMRELLFPATVLPLRVGASRALVPLEDALEEHGREGLVGADQRERRRELGDGVVGLARRRGREEARDRRRHLGSARRAPELAAPRHERLGSPEAALELGEELARPGGARR